METDTNKPVQLYYGRKRNTATNYNALYLNKDGTEVISRSDNYVIDGKNINEFAFNTYDAVSGKTIRNGPKIEIDKNILTSHEFSDMYFDSTHKTSASIFSDTDVMNPKSMIHLFHDVETGKEVLTKLEQNTDGLKMVGLSRQKLLFVNNKPNYIFHESGMISDRNYWAIRLYVYSDNDHWIQCDDIKCTDGQSANNYTQHPLKQNIVYFHNGGWNYGFDCYDLNTQTIITNVSIPGISRTIKFDTSNKTILTTDNRYTSNGYFSRPSYVKLYDIETNVNTATYGGQQYDNNPRKMVMDIMANDSIIVALSYKNDDAKKGGYLYTYDRKTNKNINTVEIPSEAFTFNDIDTEPDSTRLQTDMRFRNNDTSIALLFNTTYFYNKNILPEETGFYSYVTSFGKYLGFY
jgi:hypothetical protein